MAICTELPQDTFEIQTSKMQRLRRKNIAHMFALDQDEETQRNSSTIHMHTLLHRKYQEVEKHELENKREIFYRR